MAIALTFGFLFVALTATGIVLFVLSSHKLGYVTTRSGKAPGVSGEERHKLLVLRWTGLGIGILFGLLTFLIPGSFHTVDAGEIAVVKHLGDIRAVRTAGTYFDFWITETYEVYDAKVQTLDIQDSAYSKDAQTMDLKMTVQYQIDTNKVKEIATTYGSLEALSTKICSVSIERAKSVLSGKSAMAIIETRSLISPEVEEAIKSAISENYYVSINTAVLTNIDFSDAFEKTVEQKMIAEQQKLQAQYEAEKAKVEAEAAAAVAKIKAEAELNVARLNAEARIAAAEGEAEAQIAIASAEAQSTKLKSIEVARMLGFSIDKREIKDENDKVIATEYSIDFTGKTDAQIAVIYEYLRYLEYLSKWNGELPNVIAGDSATIMIPVPNAPSAEPSAPSQPEA